MLDVAYNKNCIQFFQFKKKLSSCPSPIVTLTDPFFIIWIFCLKFKKKMHDLKKNEL